MGDRFSGDLVRESGKKKLSRVALDFHSAKGIHT